MKGAVEAVLSDTPVVCLLEPRQCGKSTLEHPCEPSRQYVSHNTKHLLKLASIAGERFQQGIVFYDGQATLPLNKEPSILAVPISKLWEF